MSRAGFHLQVLHFKWKETLKSFIPTLFIYFLYHISMTKPTHLSHGLTRAATCIVCLRCWGLQRAPHREKVWVSPREVSAGDLHAVWNKSTRRRPRAEQSQHEGRGAGRRIRTGILAASHSSCRVFMAHVCPSSHQQTPSSSPRLHPLSLRLLFVCTFMCVFV